MPPLVRELQQDMRELNQADLSEVDPEENSAEFMGILIRVHSGALLNPTHVVNCAFQRLGNVIQAMLWLQVK